MHNGCRIITAGEMEPIWPLPVLTPLIAFELSELTNLNDILYREPFVRSKAVKGARNKGYELGLDAAKALGIPTQTALRRGHVANIRDAYVTKWVRPLTVHRIFAVLSIWHKQSLADPNEPNRTQDIYNPVVKAFIDGLTDAGLWVDDNARYHTDLWTTYKGLYASNRYTLAFYAKPPLIEEEDSD